MGRSQTRSAGAGSASGTLAGYRSALQLWIFPAILPGVTRANSIATHIHQYLLKRGHDGATLDEIREAIRSKREGEVLPHSVRSAIYQHLEGTGEALFERAGRARYRAVGR